MPMITLYDTTLRNGELRADVSLTVEEKLRIAARLEALGIDYIECGTPALNPLDTLFYQEVGTLDLKSATICAFGRTPHKGLKPADDETLRELTRCSARVVTLAGQASEARVIEVLGMSADENLQIIDASIRHLIEHGKRVFFDAEHFFDGYKQNPTYALAVLLAAWEAGADALVLCDTNGGALPFEVYKATRTTIEALRNGRVAVPVGIQAHNDTGCAVANSLEAVRAGAMQVQGSINGYGDRTGSADLLVVLANLQLKMGYSLINPEQLAQLTVTSLFVAELLDIDQNEDQPYVGQNAFAHSNIFSAGSALQRESREHVNPALIGNFPSFEGSELVDEESLLAQAYLSRGAPYTGDDDALALLDSVLKNVSADYFD